jgi:hypothetical protein
MAGSFIGEGNLSAAADIFSKVLSYLQLILWFSPLFLMGITLLMAITFFYKNKPSQVVAVHQTK